jgi:hypothetical protein
MPVFQSYPAVNALASGTPWGNLPPEINIARYGLAGALALKNDRSEHLPSSGRTSSIQRLGGRKARKEHYTRKGKLEEKKEKARKELWKQLYPDAEPANFQRHEAERKWRKAHERKVRNTLKNLRKG